MLQSREKPESKSYQQRFASKNAADEQHGQLKEQRTQCGELFFWGKMAEKPQEKTQRKEVDDEKKEYQFHVSIHKS